MKNCSQSPGHLAVQQANYSNADYANFIVKAARVDPNTTYRVELFNESTPLADLRGCPCVYKFSNGDGQCRRPSCGRALQRLSLQPIIIKGK